jgi:hypothetical protein
MEQYEHIRTALMHAAIEAKDKSCTTASRHAYWAKRKETVKVLMERSKKPAG